jgi:signal transduction histidine kinase
MTSNTPSNVGHSDSNALSVWHLWLRNQEFGARDAPNNDYMTVVSYEMRNALAVIRTAADVLGSGICTRAHAVKAQILIERQVTRITRLVAEMLDVSRVRIGQLAVQCERVDLCVIAANSVDTVEFTPLMRSHRLTVSCPDDGPLWLEADPFRLEEVFVNLLLNASKHTEPGGDIRLSVERRAGEAVVRVRDTGIGIEPHLLPHVFDLYFGTDGELPCPDPDRGIGLALVRSLVQRHGGLVTVASAGRGRGSEFTVRLPTRAG